MRRFHRLYDVPVSMELREDLLRRDLENVGSDWIRIGVNGEPSCDWSLTIKTARVCVEEGKRVVVLTRLAKLPSDEQLREMAGLGVVLSLTISSLDAWSPRFEIATRYREVGGRPLFRIVSFAFKEWALQDAQSKLERGALKKGIPVLEQPARLLKTNPTYELVDQTAYHQHEGYVSGKTRWRSAGKQLSDESAICEGYCGSCAVKCGVAIPIIEKQPVALMAGNRPQIRA